MNIPDDYIKQIFTELIGRRATFHVPTGMIHLNSDVIKIPLEGKVLSRKSEPIRKELTDGQGDA